MLMRVEQVPGSPCGSGQTEQGNSNTSRTWGVRVSPLRPECDFRHPSGLAPQREAGEWVGSWNASTVTQSSVWLLCGCKCACMCFLKIQWSHLFSAPLLSKHTYTPLTNNSTLVRFCREACALTYVWYFALSLL